MPPDDEETEEQLYCFEPAEDACDECEAAAGYYPEEPEGPHPNCNCSITPVPASECEYEVRELEADETTWEEEGPLVLGNCESDDAVTDDLTIDPDPPMESWDEHVEEAAVAAGWTDPGDISSVTEVTVPGRSELEATVVFTYYNATFVGELWRICRSEDDDGNATVDEHHVGQVGGMWLGPIDVQLDDVDTSPCADPDGGDPGGDGPYMDDDDYPGGDEGPATV